MRIIHATVLPMEGAPIQDGFVQFENGIITALGPMDSAPDDAHTLDAAGGYVLPGLVDAHCHIGICGDSAGFEADDCNEMTDPITPQLRAIDGVNPMDRYFAQSAAAGITTVLTGPGSANPIAGQFLAMKTAGRRIDDLALSPVVAMKFSLGENPKSAYAEKHEAPATRMATAALIREALFKARDYMDKLEKADKDPDFEAPDFDMKCQALIPVLRRELPAHFHAHRADDILTAVRIAEEFDLDYVIVHGTDGHRIADLLAQAGARVICGPLLTDRSKPELFHQTIQNPAVLSRAGVCVAICSDHPELPLEYLMLSASLAAKAGMDEMEALRAVTVNPAKIAGIDDRVGSIAPGKDADLVVYTGHPFAHDTTVAAVFLNGTQIGQEEDPFHA